jgi:tRNA A-37 threonylcarbamoyl transferase component Bud32/dipeptidyl aminopeptidase/acylaminoacyl peptidase
MPLESGRMLAQYRLAEKIGAGGMGEVYKARDTKLDRDVAIKVLPEAIAGDAERLSRFEREAKAVAALSHPNILAIHDFGVDSGTTYAVMELLDGETLGDRLAQGALPVRKAAEIGVQIAQGLAAAHDKGIVHRDLKPDNVFVTADGRVKILDFGLAKAAVIAADAPTHGPTRTETGAGAVLGTVGYMSPEQVKGKTADARSDIFSFGVVLYQMLTGLRPFHRDSAAETMAAILREDPPELGSSGKNVPPAFDRIVRHCLEKNPAERFQSARDLAFDLGTASDPSAPGVSTPLRERRRWRIPAVVAAVALMAGTVGLLSGLRLHRAPAAGPSMVFHGVTFGRRAIFRSAFAPDGQTVVVSMAPSGSRPGIYVWRSGFPEPQPLGLDDTHLVGVSSTNELAVLTGARYVNHRIFVGTLARVPLSGGTPRPILEGVRDAAWAPDAESLAVVREQDGRDRLEYPIGRVLAETAGYFSDLRFSRDGTRIAFLDHPIKFDNQGSVAMVDLAGKKTVLDPGPYWGEEGLAWSADGREVWFGAGSSFNDFVIHGVDALGHKRIVMSAPGGLILHDVSPDGRWLITRDSIRTAIEYFGPDGAPEKDLGWLDYSVAAALSPDGSRIVFSEQGAEPSEYVLCLRGTDGSPVVRLGHGQPGDFSPDGRFVIAASTLADTLTLYPTGPGEPRRVPTAPIETFLSAHFLDAKRLIVLGNEKGHGPRVYVVDKEGGTPRAITPEGSRRDIFASPDGSRLAVDRATGPIEIYDINGDGASSRQVPGTDRLDVLIHWSRDGKSILVFHEGEIPTRIERVDVESGRRTPVRSIGPRDTAGIMNIRSISTAADERAFVLQTAVNQSQLFLGSPAPAPAATTPH